MTSKNVDTSASPTALVTRLDDFMMVDRDRAESFSVLGQTRGIFHAAAKWPTLDHVLRERSEFIRAKRGEEVWSQVGGEFDDQGHPTCRRNSLLAADAIRAVAQAPGGLLWEDDSKIWVVRLVPRSAEDQALLAFAIGLPGTGLQLSDPQNVPQQGVLSPDARTQVGKSAGSLRLYRRAEQCLWAIHHAVLTQRRDLVLLPDVLLGQIVWGGDRSSWPQGWRDEIFRTLSSLSELHFDVFRLSGAGWQPRLGAHSVAVAYVERLAVTRPEEDCCRSTCPMWCNKERHSHFLLQVGLAFLGVLENFSLSSEHYFRRFDFRADPPGDAKEVLREVRSSGQIVSISSSLALLGGASWSGLTGTAVRVVQSLIREVTRVRRGKPSSRADRAQIVVGNRVPGARMRATTTCPFLCQKGRYVQFGGNGHRAGMGYGIVGGNGRGWLAKAGFVINSDPRERQRQVRVFLDALREAAELFGFTVAGLKSRPRLTWFDLGELRSMACSQGGAVQLSEVQLRIYAPEDYHDRLREHFAETGRFNEIPGPNSDSEACTRPDGPQDLRLAMTKLGITQRELAGHLGISQPAVSQFLGGRRRWPEDLGCRTEQYVAARERQTTGVLT